MPPPHNPPHPAHGLALECDSFERILFLFVFNVCTLFHLFFLFFLNLLNYYEYENSMYSSSAIDARRFFQ